MKLKVNSSYVHPPSDEPVKQNISSLSLLLKLCDHIFNCYLEICMFQHIYGVWGIIPSFFIPSVRSVYFCCLLAANGCPSECVHPPAAQPLHEKSLRNYVKNYSLNYYHARDIVMYCFICCDH